MKRVKFVDLPIGSRYKNSEYSPWYMTVIHKYSITGVGLYKIVAIDHTGDPYIFTTDMDYVVYVDIEPTEDFTISNYVDYTSFDAY